MSQQPQMNMPVMGGPVGGGMGGVQMNAGSPSTQPIDMSPQNTIKKLNTAIYDYLLRNQQYDIAKTFKDKMPIETRTLKEEQKQANGLDDVLDETRDQGIINRPDGLPLPGTLLDGPILQDWWCQFWEIWHAQRGRGKNNPMQYVSGQRVMQKNRTNLMMADQSMNMRPGYIQMGGMNNGMGITGQNDMRKAALQQNTQQRNMTPQQMQQMKMQQNAQNAQMMQGNAMERQGSQVDGSGPRSGSPGSGDGPSSPKRARLEGNMQQMNAGRPGQPGMQGNQVGPPSDLPHPDPAQLQQTLELLRENGIDPASIPAGQLQNLSRQPTNQQTQSVEVYSQSMQQTMQQALQNVNNKSNVNPKGMNPNMGPGGAQGSPMAQPGMDGNEFYGGVNGRMAMPQNAAASAAANQAGNNGNHALQDYQMQLMLLEQQNKKRLLMARQEQDSIGAGHPGNVGPNGQFQAPGMSPQGSQRGANPSPTPNEMRGMMDPNQMPPAMRAQMVMGPNGQMMRPPTTHPMGGNMGAQQLDAMRAQGMMPNGQFAGGQPTQAQMMQAQQAAQAGQPGQAQPMGTPRQANNMPPPPAPPANAGGTQPSSPSQQQQPPPTPNQNSKAKANNKKEPANKKGAANKKGGNAGATPATETEQPPTPTAATPATPMNNFAHKQNQQLPNGQPGVGQANTTPNQQQGGPNQPPNVGNVAAPPAQQQQQQPTDLGFPMLNDDQFNGLDLGFPIGEDNLDTFDFDSFLNNDTGDFGFDVNVAFDGDPLAMEGTN